MTEQTRAFIGALRAVEKEPEAPKTVRKGKTYYVPVAMGTMSFYPQDYHRLEVEYVDGKTVVNCGSMQNPLYHPVTVTGQNTRFIDCFYDLIYENNTGRVSKFRKLGEVVSADE